jgi:hypothetical protein
MIKYANGTKDVFAETAAAPAYSPEQAYTPPHAASTRTWVFGSQTWSDAIQLPECNKMSFTDDYTVPHCRSYTGGGNTWYYYNWAFVLQYEPLLCPAPWRVPARADLRALQADAATLISQWGYGGYARGGGVRTWDSAGYYWSSQQFVSSTAYILKFHARRVINGGLAEVKYHGYQVRCVK